MMSHSLSRLPFSPGPSITASRGQRDGSGEGPFPVGQPSLVAFRVGQGLAVQPVVVVVVWLQADPQAASHRGEQALDHTDRWTECAVFHPLSALGAGTHFQPDCVDQSLHSVKGGVEPALFDVFHH